MHIGANSSDGVLAPVFEDGRFKYIPIPEARPGPGSWTYRELGLEEWVPQSWEYAHYDPEFRTYTWGDYPIIRTHWARQLNRGDYYFFIASLKFNGTTQPRNSTVDPDWAYYVIGYFVIKEPPISISYPISDPMRRKFGNNAHIRRGTPGRRNAFLLFGGTNKTCLFEHALRFSRGKTPNEVAQEALPSVNPMNPRWWQGIIETRGVDFLLREIRRINPNLSTTLKSCSS